MRALFAVIRLLGAVVFIAAVVAQLSLSLDLWSRDPTADMGFLVLGFFSFFTIESNLIAAVALLIGVVILLVRRGEDPRGFAVLRVCATSYMAVTGIVYNLLLRGIELPQGATVPWANEVLHVVGPVLLLVDWLFAPGRRRLEWPTLGAILVFPVVWVSYTLLRGAFAIDSRTGEPWYPYPFLNPGLSPNGYLSVSFYVVLIALVFAAVGAGLIALSRRRRAGEEAETR